MKIFILLLPLFFIFFMACERHSTESINNDDVILGNLVQLGGCQRGNLGKTADEDSRFSYTFETDLTADFCVTANCCPDSNRFLLDYTITDAIIQIAVLDTAGNLCRCICPYMIHAEFSDLPEDQYFIDVKYQNELIYHEPVSR